MNKILQIKLKILAKLVLAKYKPKVVGVSGSVGKSSAKEAIHAVLSVKYRVRQNIKNYNNEIGLPLTILGASSPGRSLLGWFLVFFKAFNLLLIKDKSYPEVLVLEMGIDRPGDMDYLLSITKCDIGVITAIGQSHLEYFDSVDAIEKEKVKIIKNLKKDGTAVLNFDDERTDKIIKSLNNKILTFGFGKDAMLKAVEASHSFEKNKDIINLKGINFKISYGGSVVPVLIPDALSQTTVYSGLIGATVGAIFDIDLIKISEALRRLKMPPGRMNLINGIKHTLIIDDTYNSSPQSTRAALDTVSKLDIDKFNKKYAVLGDMLELGNISIKSHIEIGEYVVKSNINTLIVVGERAVDIARGAENAGMKKDYIFHFDDSEKAGKFVQDRINKGDLILVKGSQGVRMEKIVKEIMTEPLRAKELLCRQDSQWRN